jgi:hypothetical protein
MFRDIYALVQICYFAGALPKLYIMTVNQLQGSCDSRRVIRHLHIYCRENMAVRADEVSSIIRHYDLLDLYRLFQFGAYGVSTRFMVA